MLQVTFVRFPGERDAVYATRADGTTTSWRFPSYGDWLPHDMCHLIVEDVLGLRDGFWGLVERGASVELINGEATLVRGGVPLAQQAGADLAGLRAAEAVVARLAGTSAALGHGHIDDDRQIIEVRRRLSDAAARWRALGRGESMTFTFGERSTSGG